MKTENCDISAKEQGVLLTSDAKLYLPRGTNDDWNMDMMWQLAQENPNSYIFLIFT